MSAKEKKLANFLEKSANIIISFHFYFYLGISIIALILYFLNFIKLFNILSIIMIVTYILELLCGFDRNFLGFFGIIISGFIGYLITKNTTGILLGITIAILIVNILKRILNIILNVIINKK